LEEKKKIDVLRKEAGIEENEGLGGLSEAPGQDTLRAALLQRILRGQTATDNLLREAFVPVDPLEDGQQLDNLQQVLENLRSRGLINSEF